MEKIKNSRSASFAVIFAVYLAASALGIVVYRVLPFSFALDLLIADAVATVFTFVFSLVFKNASVYDPYWSVQPVVILVCASVIHGLTPLTSLLLAAVCFWGVRLTANWAYTFRGLTHQDWRYTMLCEKTGRLYPFVNFAGIHMFPTLVVYLCTLPAVFAFEYGAECGVLSVVFVCVSFGAAVLQGSADIQMHVFRKKAHGGFIRTGLWKYSRHPNYLGEILMWWGMGLAVVSVMPQRWYLLAGAVLNTVMFLVVSIPMADKRQSAKNGFAEYKKTTRILLPLKKFGTK